MQNKFLILIIISSIFILFNTDCLSSQNNIEINQELVIAMKAYHVPVVGYAIIKNNTLVASATLSIDDNLVVSKDSLFQAASISKSLSSYGALKLVASGKLNLDEPVNNYLITWKIPVNQLNKNNPVTLRQLLDMTSGLSVSGFPGYSQSEKLPTLDEILNGKPPANTPSLKILYKPGSKYFYSGGAFQVLEKLVEDTTKEKFSLWMKNEILKPLGMSQSRFQFPLLKTFSTHAVPGFLLDGSMLKGGWNNYAEASAGGLWATPTDLAKFAIHVSNSYHGKNNNIVTKAVAEQMLTRQKNTDYGLGVVMNGNGKALNFRKAGHNLGYHTELIMFPNSGDGAVIMTNSENGEYIINYMMALIAQKYHWPCYFPYFDELIIIPNRAC